MSPSTTMTPPAPASELRLLLVLGALMAFTSLSTDIYLPAMPRMQRDLLGDIELTITSFLVGFALAQLFWGPVSDRIGRLRPLVLGVGIFVVGSIGCAMSQTMGQMVFWRMFQAFGACTGPMLARAMVRDLYPRTMAAQTLSTLTMIMAIAPIVGPLLGGQIVRLGSWHLIFWLLAAIGVVMLMALRRLPESLPVERRTTSRLRVAFADYRGLLGNRVFMRYTLCVTLFYVSAYAFIAGSPRAYIEYFDVSPQHYGWLFAINIVGLMAVSFVNRRLVGRYRLDTLLRGATAVAALAMLAAAGLTLLQVGGLPAIVVPVLLFFSMNGIIAASATAAALDAVVPELAGSAAALIGSLQYGSGIVSSLLLAALPDKTPRALVLVMLVFAAASALAAFWRRGGSVLKTSAD
ncbi:multidrug effflux MFS transporter [Xylophilus sp. GOD-11R]|uniref:multidrug effflux MFS transporter n=1 Tax=Xylophilus sp. GOD-11R TaxID=3089814 RepID=UPI00298D36BD|nr:multidrug effflux MFS transporter [Xylophilus sp. GOD-11R]WPB58907.1 multidrug effflux MFS transporter [Xylophilus sp. GOD-11R]